MKVWWAVAMALVVVGCGDDSKPAVAPEGEPEGTPEATPEGSPEGTPEGSPEGEPEGEPEAEPGACAQPCDEAAGEHCVGGRCADRFDRACVSDGDCRALESCRDVGGALACVRGESPTLVCPGAEGCERAEGALMAGAAKAVLTTGYEQARREFVQGAEFNGDPDEPSTFIDCGLDQRCPGDPGYEGPDFGEGDGHMQGAWIAGYSHSRPAFRYCGDRPDGMCDPDKPWEGALARDDVFARVVVIQQGDLAMALVSVDGVGFFYDRERRVRALLGEGVDLDLIVIGATHVHEAPDTLGQWGPGFGGQELPVSTGAEAWWMTHVDQKIAEAIESAWGSLSPASLQVGVRKTGVDKLAVDDGRDPWIFDDEMPVMRLSRVGDGATIATLFSWGQHAEARGSRNPHITADYPGAAIRAIEGGLPELRGPGDAVVAPAVEGLGGVAIYFAGAVGGLIGPGGAVAEDRAGGQHRDETWEKVEAIGDQIGLLVLDMMAEAPVVDAPSLRVVSREFTVPVDNTQFQIAINGLRLFDRDIYNATNQIPFSAQNRPAALTRATLFTLGPATFFTVPGEIFPELLVGGYDAGVSYAFAPWLGNPEKPFCGEDLLPILCAEGCFEGWSCGGLHCTPEAARCGETSECGEGLECLDQDVRPEQADRRCLRSCVDNAGCAPGFVCLGEVGGCVFAAEVSEAMGVGSRCMVDPGNPNPPPLDEAPRGPYLKERLPGEVLFTLGLTHDELGYIMPTYDFELDPDGPYIIEPPGDHYTETNSTGPDAWPVYEAQIEALLGALGRE